ncbi:MAG: bifunctional folylpolyglutamate synthase/dihydrofolate synthase [Planctomycetales bacterium]|nr:bifunctional folylpolyglutamate synthase/dihydrofolate synthase [Planctomycetales bacterium]
MNIRTYADAERFLLDRINYERVPATRQDLRLERMVRLLKRLGDPHRHAPIVHLAGTKGKGSTAALLSHLLVGGGHRVGLYTSPHLTRLEERLRVDHVPCTEPDFIRLVAETMPAVVEMDQAGDAPTFFELSTALALQHFRESKVEFMVLETGLGGRLDSTNVCDPVVSVITSISLDHTRQLGDTLPKIAAEKCGIIKRRRPVVSGVLQPELAEIVEDFARRQQTNVARLDRDFHLSDVQLASAPEPATLLTYRSPRRTLADLSLGMLGRHQARNAALALATLEQLEQTGHCRFDETVARRALRTAQWPARIELLRKRPEFIVDVAHNVASAQALVDTLRECFPPAPGDEVDSTPGRRTLVLAISRDKDMPGIMSVLLPAFDRVVLTKFVNNPRAFDPAEMRRTATELTRQRDLPLELLVEPEPLAAWRLASQSAGPNDLVCIAGSFFLAAELRDVVLDEQPQ